MVDVKVHRTGACLREAYPVVTVPAWPTSD